MFFHAFKYTFKILSRQKAMFFWALVFPIVLGLLFKLALGNIFSRQKFEKIPVAVNEKLLEEENFKYFMDQMEKEKYFDIHKSRDKKILSENEKIVAYIEAEDKLFTSKSGLKETVVETILNNYNQQKGMIKRIFQQNPRADFTKLIDVENHIKDISKKNMDFSNTFFYTLLGMTLMYGYVWGLYVVYQYEANLSTEAKRNLMAPVKKSVTLLASILVAYLFNLIIGVIFLIYLKFGLSVDFGEKLNLILSLLLLASLTGVSFGGLIGVSNKASIEVKSGSGIAITMLCSFLAGMMSPDVKILIQENLPIINKCNPVALITDAIYSIYYYESMDKFANNMMSLGIVTLIFIFGTIFFMRGKQYESL